MSRYIYASIGSWHKKIYQEKIRDLPGKWSYIKGPKELTFERLRKIKPKYIFFPHWRWKVPDKIVNNFDCICFHETDLPFGRGGTPIQNLILKGYKDTVITAFKMVPKLDAGPIYIKNKLSLKGSAQDVYTRSSEIIFRMIKKIIKNKITPYPQKGNIVYFKRRKPCQSKIIDEIKTLDKLYDFIRMLDAGGYPHAFIRHGIFRIEFKEAKLKKNNLDAEVRITIDKADNIK